MFSAKEQNWSLATEWGESSVISKLINTFHGICLKTFRRHNDKYGFNIKNELEVAAVSKYFLIKSKSCKRWCETLSYRDKRKWKFYAEVHWLTAMILEALTNFLNSNYKTLSVSHVYRRFSDEYLGQIHKRFSNNVLSFAEFYGRQ